MSRTKGNRSISSNRKSGDKSASRVYCRKRLRELLEFAEDEDFFQLLWAAQFLQSDNPGKAKQLLQPTSYHPDAVGPNVPMDHRVHPWELETLANLVLATPKSFEHKGKVKKLRSDNHGNIVDCVNRLRNLENAEYTHDGHERDALMGLSRVAHRQFPWQTGYVNTAHLYRNIFVYGQGKCADYFENTYGISINRFSFVSFLLFMALRRNPHFAADNGIPQIDISKDELERTLALVATPHSKARARAKEEQHKVNSAAYMPSILRRTPCVMFEDRGRCISAPLPELIIDRISSGLFYDIVKYSGSGDDFGPRFESYCLEYLRSTLGEFDWKKEHRYGPKKSKRSTPDILGNNGDLLQFVFECKAKRMSHEAMFQDGPTLQDGIEDLGKGIRQIWTFYADSRKGLTGHTLSPNVFGAVLTMDNWGTMGQAYIKEFFDEAERQIAKRGLDVWPEDRRPILIIPIQSLERALAKVTQESFLEACALAQTVEYDGWLFEDVHQRAANFDATRGGGYPFTSRLGKLLPWWEEFQQGAGSG